MNEIARAEPQQAQRLSITNAMANRFNMEGDAFMATLNATVFGDKMNREEKAAFLVVAWEHRLNPITREIYAMPKKGGGIIPVVSIDGWVRLANEHPAFDGMDFEDHHDGEKLISTTCRIFRKDRSRPIAVTEYLSECIRETEPWKMKHRMLRHKAMIQCARYAFGFAGIYDPDEAERFAADDRRAPAPAPLAPMIEHAPEPAPQTALRQIEQKAAGRRPPSPTATAPDTKPEPVKTAPLAVYDPEDVRKRFTAEVKTAADRDALNTIYDEIVKPFEDEMLPPDRDDLIEIYDRRLAELGG